MLAANVEELVDAAGEVLVHLHGLLDVKCALIGAARRRGSLDDDTLCCLMEEGAEILDLSGCGGRVTDAGIVRLAAAGALRRVVAVDITGCDGITGRGIGELARGAPRMHTLRCGGDAACNAAVREAVDPSPDEAAAWGGILPRLVVEGRGKKARGAPGCVLDSWEELVAEDEDRPTDGDAWVRTGRAASEPSGLDGGGKKGDGADDIAAPVGTGAHSLRWLVWPDADARSRAHVARQCPRVRLVAPPSDIYAAAAAVASDPHFVAMEGEGWVGYGSAVRDGGQGSDGLVMVTTKGIERGDGRCGVESPWMESLVDGGSEARADPRGGGWRHPWWLKAEDAAGLRPPLEADPTAILDAAAVARLNPSAWGGVSTRRRARGALGGGAGVSRAASHGSGGGEKVGVGQSALRWRLGFAEDKDDVPIAERFKRACEEVEQERSIRREKNYRKGKNRRMRRLGSAEQHIHRALDDLSLVNQY